MYNANKIGLGTKNVENKSIFQFSLEFTSVMAERSWSIHKEERTRDQDK